MDIITYAKSKSYTDETWEGGGIAAGKNCTIDSITNITGGHRVTFKWTLDNGTEKTSTMDVMDGEDGLSVASAAINPSNNHLILTMTDSTTKDCGEVPTVHGEQGEDGKSAYEIAVEQGYSGTEEEWLASLKGEDGEEGFSPEITVKESTSERYVLTITNKDGSYDTPNLKSGGSGSATNLSDLEDVQLTSLTTGQILKWNGSKWVNEDGVEIDSLGDINDVALGTLTDGQVLSWNATLGKWENKDAVNPTQFATMPTAADYPEAIVQYIGADTATYKRGMFYRSNPSVVSGSVVYTWEQTDVQPSNSDYEQLSNHPEIENVELVGNKTLDDLGINGKFQYSTLPTATVSNAGKIVQYIGTTTADYKKGFWYQSAYDSETSEYVWKNIDVSSNAQLATRIAQLETNQGDMSQLEVVGVSDIVAALNALNGKGLSTITYTEPNLILTYEDGTTKTFNVRDSILNETQIGELANVTDTTVANGNVLQYDSAILGYKPYDILTALTTLLTESKDYTDQEIASSLTASAYVCDAKPQYDSVNDLVIYFQNGQAHTTDKTDSRFYYTTSDGSFCSSWIESTEFTFNVAQVDYDDYVNKNTDVVSTYTEDMADKSKIPDVSALDALLAIVKTALALKVNTSSIIDALTSQDATKVLSANQGYVIKGLIDDKNDKIQFATMPTPASALSGIVYQYVGSSSQAFVKGHFYTCLYDNVNDTWYWSEIKYAADTDNALDPTSKNPVANDALCEEFDKKQDKDLETPIEVDGTEQTTVEDTLSALNTYAAKKVDQLNSLPVASADTLGMLVQYKGATTSTLKHAFFYECKVVEGSDPTEYEWVDAGIGGEDLSQYKKIFSGTSAEWDALPLEDKITYDYIMPDDDGETGDITDVVESGNHNAVESDAVYNSEQEIYEVMGKMGAKNLLPNIATSESYASSGTVTKNLNGSLTINGTFDAVTTINIDYLNGLSNAVFDVTDLIGTDIVVTFLDTAVSGITLEVGYFNSAGTRISLEGGVSTKANITFPAGAVKSATYLRIASGTYDNVTVYPMMQLASDTDSTYQPYVPTNKVLNESKVDWKSNGILGTKNLLPNEATNSGYNGVEFVVNSDGTVNVTGPATSGNSARLKLSSIYLKRGRYILSAGVVIGAGNYIGVIIGAETGAYAYTTTNGEVEFEVNDESTSYNFFIRITDNASGTYKFYPMLRLATDSDSTYQPYAKSNQELTKDSIGLFENVNKLGAKNLNVYPYRDSLMNGYTTQGITFTPNEDGSIRVHGTLTSTGEVSAQIHGRLPNTNPLWLKKGEYKVTRGGNYSGPGNLFVTVGTTKDGAFKRLTSTDEEPLFDITNDTSDYIDDGKQLICLYIYLYRLSVGDSIDTTIYPMIRLASDPDDTYEPYAKGNQELTKDVAGIQDNLNEMGTKNLLPLTLSNMKKLNTDGTWNGNVLVSHNVTYTFNHSGDIITSIKVTPNGNNRVGIRLLPDMNSDEMYSLYQGDILSCNGSSNSNDAFVEIILRESPYTTYAKAGYTENIINVPNDNTIPLGTYLRVPVGSSEITLYPMIRLGSDTDGKFEPYAMSNREITEELSGNTIIVENGQVNVKASTGTVADLLYSLSTAIGNVLSNMADNETLEVYRINIQSHANIFPQLKTLTNQSYADLYGIAVESTATTCNIFRLTLEHSAASNNKLRQCHLESNGTSFLTPSDESITAERTYTAYYRKFRKI